MAVIQETKKPERTRMITANAKRRERDIEAVEFIAANGPITASQLANRLKIPPQTAHRILARLKSEMLCKGHKEYGKPAEWDLSEHAIKPR